MRILLTGASGLVGSHLVPLLRPESELHLYQGDLTAGLDTRSLPPRVDAVVHLAQSRRFRDFPDGAGDVARVNALAAVELAQYAAQAGASHFVYLSTGGVYAPAREPLTEAAPLADDGSMGFYAASKRAGELLLAPFASRFSLIVLRPFFIYGRGQERSMLIPRLADCVKTGAPIRLAGRDGIRINPIHASDAAAAVRAALQLRGSHRINLAGPETLTIRTIAEEIGRHLGRAPVLEIDDAAAPADLIGDTGLMARLLGAPRERLAGRIDEVVERA
ncbi:MAG: NAD(P)-dependent oxidoreductase [Pseudomonadota bacterium]|nr:NAD(P)-dependent oxidoreductase [Pseudomonadota bacterium]